MRSRSVNSASSGRQLNSATTSHGGTEPSGQTGRHSAATATLLAVSFYLIATTLPVTLCYVLYLGFPEGDPNMTVSEQQTDPTWTRFYIYGSVRALAEELGMSHYSYTPCGGARRWYVCVLHRGCVPRSWACRTTRATSTSTCARAACSGANCVTTGSVATVLRCGGQNYSVRSGAN